MPLRTKEGHIYKLAGPNPVMREQKLWGDYVVHNMKWKSENAVDETEVSPIQSDFQVKEDFVSELARTKPDETRVIEQPLTEKVEVKQEKKDLSSVSGIEKTFIHCLPMVLTTKVDPVYGDKHQSLSPEKPFSFEGVLIEESDFHIQYWASIKVEPGSVLYPKSMSKRWWRVQEVEPKAGGWLLTAMPSDFQPYFTSA